MLLPKRGLSDEEYDHEIIRLEEIKKLAEFEMWSRNYFIFRTSERLHDGMVDFYMTRLCTRNNVRPDRLYWSRLFRPHDYQLDEVIDHMTLGDRHFSNLSIEKQEEESASLIRLDFAKNLIHRTKSIRNYDLVVPKILEEVLGRDHRTRLVVSGEVLKAYPGINVRTVPDTDFTAYKRMISDTYEEVKALKFRQIPDSCYSKVHARYKKEA